MKVVYLIKSDKINKKYYVFIDNKKIYFGSSGYQDYTTHRDDKRKQLYLNRHKKNEDDSPKTEHDPLRTFSKKC